jgi:Domain of unknown function (DUF4134)
MKSNLHIVLLQSWNQVHSAASSVHYSIGVLCYALAAVCGLVGAIRIYNKWQLGGDQFFRLEAELAGWAGASLFFIIARVLIKVIF